ncbi:MAG: rRNA pseudouridine synthase [Clostridia bacterium]|nr:rRNA pseudouridine synthase [Clostridia bacterium]
MRLDKMVALSGVSRKDAKKVIASGRVKVNGEVIRDAGRVIPDDASIEIGGIKADIRTEIHIMIHKPAGVLTATEDARGEKTVLHLLPPALQARKIGPVGRLDKDVTGLVIMTTDGQLAHRLISPKWENEKEYIAKVEGQLDESCAEQFSKGVPLKDFTAKPASLKILSADENESLCLVSVTEGKYHQVKRMLASVGHPVITLHRQSIAGIRLDDALSQGEWRYLTDDETAYLYKITEMDTK